MGKATSRLVSRSVTRMPFSPTFSKLAPLTLAVTVKSGFGGRTATRNACAGPSAPRASVTRT